MGNWEFPAIVFAASLLSFWAGFRMGAARHVTGIAVAWGIIANAGRGDWTKESREWRTAAHRWERDFHRPMGARIFRRGPLLRLREWWANRKQGGLAS